MYNLFEWCMCVIRSGWYFLRDRCKFRRTVRPSILPPSKTISFPSRRGAQYCCEEALMKPRSALSHLYTASRRFMLSALLHVSRYVCVSFLSYVNAYVLPSNPLPSCVFCFVLLLFCLILDLHLRDFLTCLQLLQTY